MRLTFLIPTQTVRTTTKKTVKSVVGGVERLDVISRCLLNLFQWKDRFDVSLSLIVYLSHKEEEQAFFIELDDLDLSLKTEFSSTKTLINILEDPINSKIQSYRISFDTLLDKVSSSSFLYYLTPEGENIDEFQILSPPQQDVCFILGSQYDLTNNQEQKLENLKATRISLGNQAYLASHVVTIVCNHLFLQSTSKD